MIKKLFFGFLFVLLIGNLYAFEYSNNTEKWNLCNAQNFTELVCDSWWLGNFPNITFISPNQTEQSYIIGVENNTYISSNITNSTLQNYFNGIQNGTYVLNSTINATSQIYFNGIQNGTYVLYSDMQLNLTSYRDNLLANRQGYGYNPNNYTNQNQNGNYQQQPVSQNDNTLIILFGMIFVGLFVVLIFMLGKKGNGKQLVEYPTNNSQYYPQKWDWNIELNKENEEAKKSKSEGK